MSVPTPSNPLLALGDALLQAAPHNVLASLFVGGALGPLSTPPRGVTLRSTSSTGGRARWLGGSDYAVLLEGEGSGIVVTAPSNMALVLYVYQLRRRARWWSWARQDKYDEDFKIIKGPAIELVMPGRSYSSMVRSDDTVVDRGITTVREYAVGVTLVAVRKVK